jgi:hypothetical protein
VAAQHLSATYALYTLNKNLSLHTLLPPTYREAWERWLAEEKQQATAIQESLDRPRRDFVQRCFDEIQQRSLPVTRGAGGISAGGGGGGASRGNSAVVARSQPVSSSTPSAADLQKDKGVRAASAALKAWLTARCGEPSYTRLASTRTSLPVAQFKQEILRQVFFTSFLVTSPLVSSLLLLSCSSLHFFSFLFPFFLFSFLLLLLLSLSLSQYHAGGRQLCDHRLWRHGKRKNHTGRTQLHTRADTKAFLPPHKQTHTRTHAHTHTTTHTHTHHVALAVSSLPILARLAEFSHAIL